MTGKQNDWNVKLGNNNIKQIEFDSDVTSLKFIKTNIELQTPETLASEVYITEVEKQATTAKSTELENWKKQRGLC